jgi:hypothetical protein
MALIVFTTFTMLTPPPELIATLLDDAPFRSNQIHERDRWLIEEAYKAGADQELEACCEWLAVESIAAATELRDFRRLKPPSLKEQALEALGPEPLPETGPTGDTILNQGSIEHHRTIRRALEALPND